MLPSKGYAAIAANAPLEPFQFECRDHGPTDVLVQILYCGICHSDIDFVKGLWPNSIFPMVPGHEITGRVTKIGVDVTKYNVGDLVAVGAYVDSCRVCQSCLHHEEQYCLGNVSTFNHLDKEGKMPLYGGFSNQIVVDEHFVLKVPTKLSLAGAAPLMCAGITTFSPLRHWKVGKDSKVGIVGLGGLGHLAVKFAAAMGAEVTVLSTSEKKLADAKQLGAAEYGVTSDPATFQRLGNSLDLILNTVSGDLDYNPYLGTLKRDGTFVQLGVPESAMAISPIPLLTERKRVAGSKLGSVNEMQEMLDFCAGHNIVADIETITIDQVNEAFARVLKGDVRYRFVIDMSSLR